MAEAVQALHPERGPVAPLLIPRMLGNMASAQVAIALGLRGPNFATSSACATGAHAIGEAAEIIKRGDAQVMLCGASEACITPLTIAGDDALGALSRWNDTPEQASRPFDIRREGFVLAEGAGILVLEDMERARPEKLGSIVRSRATRLPLTPSMRPARPRTPRARRGRCRGRWPRRACRRIGSAPSLPTPPAQRQETRPKAAPSARSLARLSQTYR